MPTCLRLFVLKSLVPAGLGIMAAFNPDNAFATLGEPEATVQTDVALTGGSLKIMDRSSYRLHEIQMPSGTRLREFARTDGVVFAVAWNGPVMPNLQQTLGKYFAGYVSSAKANRLGHHHLSVQQEDLVIEVSGHMRAFSGRAYLPNAIPAGVSIGEVF